MYFKRSVFFEEFSSDSFFSSPIHDEKVYGLRSARYMMSGDFRIPELRLGPPEGGNHLLVPPSPCQPRRRHSWICR
ncbi:hypothetical protein WA026_017246 [Henosepilachna vigintioctopunctata]|uniref:Uncharacterized protein n=1 Tax=Henosepilachna vigintioctopunctata TaxID=420089 RepID=A0AAW1UDI3_9CUCU